jgi:hypothetical protein
MDEQPGQSQSQPGADQSSAPSQKPAQSFSGLVHSREFLETLAAASQPQSSDTPAKPKRPSHRPLLLAMAAVLALLLVLAREHDWRPWMEQGTVPEVFYGTWGTSSARYADRGFVITRDSVLLVTGPGRGFAYPIVGVSRPTGADTTLFTLRYRDDGQDLTLLLRLEPDSTIHLASLPMVVWTKKSP